MNIRLFVCALRCETHPRMLARHRQDDITSSSDVSSLYLNLHLLLLPSWARGFRIAIYSSTVFIYLDPPRASNFSPQVCFWGWGAQISDPWRIQVYPPGNCPISPISRHFWVDDLLLPKGGICQSFGRYLFFVIQSPSENGCSEHPNHHLNLRLWLPRTPNNHFT